MGKKEHLRSARSRAQRMRSGGEIGQGWAWRVVAEGEGQGEDHWAAGGVVPCAVLTLAWRAKGGLCC